MADETLIVFSSGARPLYARNVLEALAKPRGYVQLLRYSREWLPAETASRWGEGLHGMPARLHYVLQHPDDYFEPVLFPVRAGTVKSAYKEGSSHFVLLELTDDISVINPADEKPDYTAALHDYQAAFASLPRPKKYYASTVPDSQLPPLFAGDRLELFERNTELLAKADPFGDARFVKVLRVVRHSDGAEVVFDRDSSAYLVDPDTDYRIDLLSYQPKGMHSEETFTARVDGAGISLLGRTQLRLASRYDRLSLTLRTSLPAGVSESPATVHLEPDDDIYGPFLEFSFRVRRRDAEIVKDAALGSLAVSLIAAPGPLSTWKPWLAGVVFVIAVVVAFMVQLLRGISVAGLASYASSFSKGLAHHNGGPTASGPSPPDSGGSAPPDASGDTIRV